VAVAPATLERLPRVGEAVELHTELQLREDGMTLYGFPDPADRTWFRLLQTVQGVGARVALSLLGTLRPHELANAIAAGDKAMLARATGVGGRLAARIAAELKDRVGSIPQPGRAEPPGAALTGPAGDALSALLHLGYARAEAYAALARVHARLGADVAVEVLVREGLKELTA
jgi:Holliday junction DNA helicase RuvA